ncbi:hypothetical protein JCM19239_3943 [Vibrio variabilis]|uniref:Uncharacterized protein n=1 Tax=Vibrio variabilis TaxID=990271 RepID=A0ABQ0J633_9VIBR|nr:hypothetical protein JCM19239_3943 [Vibrio variabilis]
MSVLQSKYKTIALTFFSMVAHMADAVTIPPELMGTANAQTAVPTGATNQTQTSQASVAPLLQAGMTLIKH